MIQNPKKKRRARSNQKRLSMTYEHGEKPEAIIQKYRHALLHALSLSAPFLRCSSNTSSTTPAAAAAARPASCGAGVVIGTFFSCFFSVFSSQARPKGAIKEPGAPVIFFFFGYIFERTRQPQKKGAISVSQREVKHYCILATLFHQFLVVFFGSLIPLSSILFFFFSFGGGRGAKNKSPSSCIPFFVDCIALPTGQRISHVPAWFSG